MYSTIPDKFLYDGNNIAQKLPTSNLQNKEFHTYKYSLQTSPHFFVDHFALLSVSQSLKKGSRFFLLSLLIISFWPENVAMRKKCTK